MAANVHEVRTYHYYTNGFYELESVDPGDGTEVVRYQRNFLAPIPPEDLIPLVQEGHIDPADHHWREGLIALLNNHHFFTVNISAGEGTDVGKIKSEYIKEFFTLKTVRTVAAATIFTAASFYTPYGIARFLPTSWVAKIGLPAIGTSSAMRYSLSIWKKIFPSKLVEATIGMFSAAAIPLSIGFLSKRWQEGSPMDNLKKQITSLSRRVVGTLDYKTWCSQVARTAFSHIHDRPIPHQFENDPVLSQNQCPITQTPIRHPCRLPCHETHLFELISLDAWFQYCVDNRVDPTCPQCRAPFTRENLVISDQALSDMIELRILLLSSQIH